MLKTVREQLLAAITLPDTPVKRLCVGVHMSAVESETVGCGYTLRDPENIPHLCHEVRGAGNLAGESVRELAKRLCSSAFLDRGLGMAALNSVVNSPENKAQRGDVLFAMKQKFTGAKIAMVGHFPFAPEINSWAGEFHVVERNPVEDDLSGEEGFAWLGKCDAVIITGVTILNDSLPEVMKACPQAFKLMLGPTIPLHNWLLDYGIDALCSLLPVDADAYYRSIAEGAIVPRYNGIEAALLSKEDLHLPTGDFRPRLCKAIDAAKACRS